MKHILDWPPNYRTRLVPVIQGEFHISDDKSVAFSTILGSCVSVCMFDAESHLGGMNHFLLAGSATDTTKSVKYGVHAMELMINALLKAGANRSRLQAKAFGGSKMSGRFGHIGTQNATFAQSYLQDEGIALLGHDLGGTSARRVNFHPFTGAARSARTIEPVREEIEPIVKAAETVTQKKTSDIQLF